MIALIDRLFENSEDLYFFLFTGAYALYILFLEEKVQQMVAVKHSAQSDQHIAPKEKEEDEDEKEEEEEDAVKVDAVEDEEGEEVDIYLHSLHRVLDRLRRETAAAKY